MHSTVNKAVRAAVQRPNMALRINVRYRAFVGTGEAEGGNECKRDYRQWSQVGD